MEHTLTHPTGRSSALTCVDGRLRRLLTGACPRIALKGLCALTTLMAAAVPGFAAQDEVVTGVMAATVAPGTASAAPQTAAADAVAMKRVESRICRAETNFQLGLDEYRAANAGGHADTVCGRDHLRQAKAYFLLAKDDLAHALPAFGDTAAPADAERRLDAVALDAYNERLLRSVDRAEEP
jgi:hypothetical protein